MELMATCLEKLSKRIKCGFPEDILGNMTVTIINALNYLKVSQVNQEPHLLSAANLQVVA